MGNQDDRTPLATVVHTQSDQAEAKLADSVISNLMADQAVEAADARRAQQWLVDRLWDNADPDPRVKRGMLVLFVSSESDVDRAALIGELVAAGDRSDRVLGSVQQALQSASTPSKLAAEDVAFLRTLLNLSTNERLDELLTAIAAAQALYLERGNKGENKTQIPTKQTDPGDRKRKQDQPEPTQDQGDGGDSSRTRKDSPGGPGPADRPRGATVLEAESEENPHPDDILDSTRSIDERMQIAQQLGPSAIPALAMLLENAEQREFAYSALIHMAGLAPVNLREVDAKMRDLETTNPDLRPVAEFVRKTANPRNLGSPEGSRRLLKNADIQEGWIRRAFANCDRPNILKASLGRETTAIALGVQQWLKLRTS